MFKPFLKCAGGKSQLLKTILPLVPEFDRYIEPFVGGGALLFALQPTKAIINDACEETSLCYVAIRDCVDDLIRKLKNAEDLHSEDFYYLVRFEDRRDEYKNLDVLKKVSRWMYLNKTCYNGLMRKNKSNQLNIPMGDYKNPKILDEKLLRNVNNYLGDNNIQIFNEDFEVILEKCKEGDFVYLDPPYYPISETSSFTAYTKQDYTKEDQIRLKKTVDKLTKKGIKCLISNSYCSFILDLWKDYEIAFVDAKRNIAANVESRKEIKEVLIKNYWYPFLKGYLFLSFL
ncbi:MAG: Dam family site-specific DNA-(adenine-N6)-methyltransferase [Mycoplasma sp.]|nr:Dam family site-specific DNA-(adenine-N6)-methyltransferase [Mycoplasma sp.]